LVLKHYAFTVLYKTAADSCLNKRTLSMAFIFTIPKLIGELIDDRIMN
jgi:hypothetical protein